MISAAVWSFSSTPMWCWRASITAALAIAIVLAPASEAAQAYRCPITPTWGWLASPYGWRRHPMGGGSPNHHWGIDIAASAGTPVLATMDGTVAYAGWHGGYGIVVYLLHAGEWSSLYGHLQAFAVRTRDRVRCGQVIGWVGSTGASTGPHLHFELRYRGYPVDPIPYLIAAHTRRRVNP